MPKRALTADAVHARYLQPTLVVNVRLPKHTYDRYCLEALRHDVPVRRVLRSVLVRAAPKAFG